MNIQSNPSEIAAGLRAMGLSKSYASEIASGKRTPGYDLALRIEKAFDIPPRFWGERQKSAA
ncbi:helix-turn-helix transcriptional regulator [Asticcacaulis sp.]|uniref:helix-turn-helix transcriptional regulator n=1 Tax=Asticcacaulis sp. TaxID=1872648 RepID=UPI0039E45ACF